MSTSTSVILGPFDSPATINVSSITIHQDYDHTHSPAQGSNIALLKLSTAIDFLDDQVPVHPICLGQEGDIPIPGQVVYTGWLGFDRFSLTDNETEMREVVMDVVSNEQCALETNLPEDSTSMFCARTPFTDNLDDGSGPAVAMLCDGRWVQVGVSISLPGNSLVVFTKISSFFTWINDTTSDNTC
ncbi:hypothetical protein Pcinc_031635 [Petrolisthes cinctipes]|uniref:Peptidase S1 domain-containing protein n=1 Tax=Petrolisthes cinctipes TaxID=88211 RepID=A0AAE1K497_PETCI|nr:hypothetical protein Pcinc_031635 [Petrolisthes cinctipes]